MQVLFQGRILITLSIFTMVLAVNIIEFVDSACRCSQILSQADCDNKCKWHKDTNECLDKKCNEIDNVDECFKRKCAYMNGQCQKFQGCNTIQSEINCNLSVGCTFNETCDDEIADEIACGQFIQMHECNNQMDSSGNYCIWVAGDMDENAQVPAGGDYGTCKGYAFTSCDSANKVTFVEQLCVRKPNQCAYENDTCTQMNCTYFSNKEQCEGWNITKIIDDVYNKVYLCTWANEKCVNGYDIELLNSTDCYDESTLYQLTWDSTHKLCTYCPGYSQLIMTTATSTVSISEKCGCTDLKNKSDCTAQGCTWSSSTCTEYVSSDGTTYPTSQLCASVTLPENDCANTIGCAYIEGSDGKLACEQFSGCIAYSKTTNDDCQKVSLKCTTDGVTCIDPLKCEEYLDQTLCAGNISTTGTGRCKWNETDKKCLDQECSDAPTTNTTDTQCDRFLKGCISNGKGCTLTLEACSTYSVDDCLGRKGSDGYCESKDTACQPIPCTEAPEYAYDLQCSRFQVGCVSTGKGCIIPPLPLCSTYEADATKCLLMIGSDGKCEGDGNKNCRARQCSSATYTTLKECDAYKTGCLTNGVSCVDTLSPCSNASDNCDVRIGSDGNCKTGASTQCEVRTCADASTKLMTDTDCSSFQKGCVTNGQGCVATKQLCKLYSGTTTTCVLYIGSDGRCKGSSDTTDAPCLTATCTDAPTDYKTHAQCQQFYSTCLTNGAGCVTKETCLASASQPACEGSTSCYWSQSCVTATCSQYVTISLCSQNKENKLPCFWTGTACRLTLCSDASLTLTTDADCDKFLSGCLTNLGGCVDPTTPCSDYKGTDEQCKSFTGNGIKCWGTSTTATNCADRLCSYDVTSTTDTDCATFMSTCKTKGTGCISQTEPCSSYSGTQAQCSSFKGSDGACYNDLSSTGACRVMVCTDNTTSTTDADCNTFLTGCVYGGAGCLASTEPCTSFTGASVDQCKLFKGASKLCWWESGSNCVDKICTHNTTATTDQDCKDFLSGCLTNGQGCLDQSLDCTNYTGTDTQCLLFTGNSKTCVRRDQCTQKNCTDITSPQSASDCTDYLDSCRFDGTQCVTSLASCSSYSGSSTICQTLTDSTGKGCWLPDGSNGSCADRICSNLSSAASQSDCDTFLSGCVWDGTGCQNKQATCSAYTNFSQDACKVVKTTGGTNCWKNDSATGPCEDISCANIIDSPSADTCAAHLSTCVYTGAACFDKQAACTSYTGFAMLACQQVKRTDGEYCWATADGNCVERQCSDVVAQAGSTLTNSDCQTYLSSCRYGTTDGTNFSCLTAKTICTDYTPLYTATICRQLTTSTGNQCWKLDQAVAGACDVAQADCTAYTNSSQEVCQSVKDANNRMCWKTSTGYGTCEARVCNNVLTSPTDTACRAHLSSYPNVDQCRYSGSACVVSQDDCQKYSNFTSDACRNTTTKPVVGPPYVAEQKCWKTSSGSGTCENRTCEQNVVNPSYDNCIAHLATCTFNGTGCSTKQNYCSEYISFTAAQCQVVQAILDGLCYSTGVGIGNCVKRTCQHNTTASTDQICENFLTGCVTNGSGCVPKTNSCTSYQGTISACNSFVGCTRTESSGSCSIRACTDNEDATTDADCAKFLTGCLTKGKGCIASTEPCTQYLGTRDTCKNFIGNGRRCWNTTTATSKTACTERLCTDDTSSTTDAACQAFQYSCVTNGAGCIDASLPCSSYQGTQTTCALFKGISGTKKCWNVATATATTVCLDRICSHNSKATSDKDCDSFLTGCITKGTGCVAPQNCANFLGTIKTCAGFSAKDKPCKGVSNVVAACQSVKCYEASNTLDTDEKCENFKSGCKSTGFGCIDGNTIQCEDIQTQTTCTANTSCVFAKNCRDVQNDCTIFKSESVCVTTPVSTSTKKCSWRFDSAGVGSCQNWACSDASQTITTDSGCSALYDQCTTTGSGCITKQSCKGYLTSVICLAAKTTDAGDTCVWDKTYCRAKQCSDASKAYRTDAKCKTYMDSCVTTGQGCDYPTNIDCTKIVTQARCTTDAKSNAPCIWKSAACVQYTGCEDISTSATTFSECQAYSEKCISDGEKCQAITICSRYKNQTACIYGTDGVCGWIPAIGSNAAQCVVFTKCEQAASKDQEVCTAFSSSCSIYKHSKCTSLPVCVTDGTQCVSMGKCSTYLTEIACNNEKKGTDGKCFWEKGTSTSTCRLRECTDATVANANNIVTHASCNAFEAKNICTTNSTNCIDEAKCATYDEKSCFYGLDGECILDTTDKKCRVKICTDFKETSTKNCDSKLTGCISDGTACLSKATCTTYTTETSCHSTGTDGVCIWTKGSGTTPGTCTLMTKCEDGASDQVACKMKSAACVSSTSACISQTCNSLAVGTKCSPLMSFDGKTATICIPNPALANATSSNSSSILACIVGDASSLTSTNCYSYTAYTYTWDTGSAACSKCVTTTTNTTTNTSTTNTSTNTSTEDSGTMSWFIGVWLFILS